MDRQLKSDQRRVLEWIQRNRARRERATAIGRLAEEMGKAATVAHTDLRAAAEALSLLVDDEFREHCRLSSPEHGTLVVCVDQPTRVFAVRARWAECLRRALRKRGGLANFRSLSFEWGDKGMSLPAPLRTDSPAKGR
ncbi:MAG: hypothetical protein HY763_04520 [Planctomycetes bacterium]|nr:hypothetical protein [Planctomycetota bacterium]